jgi:hypothetical protein
MEVNCTEPSPLVRVPWIYDRAPPLRVPLIAICGAHLKTVPISKCFGSPQLYLQAASSSSTLWPILARPNIVKILQP